MGVARDEYFHADSTPAAWWCQLEFPYAFDSGDRKCSPFRKEKRPLEVTKNQGKEHACTINSISTCGIKNCGILINEVGVNDQQKISVAKPHL